MKEKGAWCAAVHGFAKSQTELSDWTTVISSQQQTLKWWRPGGLSFKIKNQGRTEAGTCDDHPHGNPRCSRAGSEKGERKLSEFANNVLTVLENPTGNGKNVKALRKVAGYDTNIFKNQCLFYIPKIKCIRIHDIIKVNWKT